MFRPFRLIFFCLLLISNFWPATSVIAAPFVEAGDLALHHDITVLSDAGVISAPVSTWPIAWNSIAIDVKDPKLTKATPRTVINSLRRVQRRLQKESRKGRFNFTTRLAARSTNEQNIPDIRKFDNLAREKAEASFGVEWMGKSTAFKLNATYADEAQDNEEARLDGSYFGYVSNGWSYSIGAMERWWGPGYEGSLILSNNARPVPAFSIQKIHAKPFETKWLSWLGPWQFQFFMGQMESDRYVPRAKLIGARLNFKPLTNLEIGLSRAAQMGGEGRPEDFETFTRMLLGQDNAGEGDISRENQPGNQLAGFDIRWKPSSALPLALYLQRVGEDQSGIYPTANMYLLGIENWGMLANMDYRVHLELADTHSYRGSTKNFNTSYNHAVYETGYRYFDRVIGHSMDNDGKMMSFGLQLFGEDGSNWGVLLRNAELNTDGTGRNTVSSIAQEYTDIILSHSMNLSYGQLGMELKSIKIKDVASGVENTDNEFSFEWITRF